MSVSRNWVKKPKKRPDMSGRFFPRHPESDYDLP